MDFVKGLQIQPFTTLCTVDTPFCTLSDLFLLCFFFCSGTSDDEMCNFYIMYYTDSRHVIPSKNCMKTGSKELFQHIPAEANVPIPVSPGHMSSMMHMGHSAGTKELDVVHFYPCNPKLFNLRSYGLFCWIDSDCFFQTFLPLCLLA